MTSSKQRSSLMLLPSELVEEILYRIQIESVGRFKSVCKQWNAFFNDKRFFYKHLDLSEERIIGLMDQKSFQVFNVESKALLSLPTPDELHYYTIEETVHCDGLLLCKCIENQFDGYFHGFTTGYLYADTNSKLAVWNPVLSQVIWIEPSSPYKNGEFYGFGYDNVSRDNYKILRIHTKFDGKGNPSREIEIYEFKSKLWRSLNATLDWNSLGGAVSMKGDVYWIAGKNMVNNKIELSIQSFDFSTETFKTICCVPDGVDWFRSDHKTLVLSGYGGDRLSLLQRHEHVKVEVWVTNKVTDDGILSWSNHVSIPDPSIKISSFHDLWPTAFILKTNTIMLWCPEFKKNGFYTNYAVYELSDDGEIKEHVQLAGRCGSRVDKCCNVYVPSLVPVPE